MAVSALGAAGENTEIGGVKVSNVNGDPSLLGAIAGLVVDGTVRTAIRRTYALGDAAQALCDFTNEHTLGKLVITMPEA